VDSTDLKAEQVARLKASLLKQLNYLNKLCSRMQRLGWPLDDPLCRAAMRARIAAQDLYSACNVAGRKLGVRGQSTSRNPVNAR
jgi:hypothetical protein